MKKKRAQGIKSLISERNIFQRQNSKSFRVLAIVLVLAMAEMAIFLFSQTKHKTTITPDKKEAVSYVPAYKPPSDDKRIKGMCDSQPLTTPKRKNPKPVTSEKSNVWPPDWSNFLPSLLATFVGALLGFLSAIKLNRWAQKRLETKEMERQRKRSILLLELLAEEIRRNQHRLNKMKSELATTPIIDYSVTLDVWSAISKEVLDALRDSPIAQTVAQLYDCLSLVASALLFYNRLALGSGDDLIIARKERLPRVENLVNEAANLTTIATKELSKEIMRLKTEK